MKDVLVICTRNRSADMVRCLESLLQQRRMPLKVLVVDSSDTNETADLSEEFRSQKGLPFLEYVHTAPGLTLQRNVALRMVRGEFDVVHFVDDDVELEPGYIDELLNAFEKDASLVGAGGLIKGAIVRKHRLSLGLEGAIVYTQARFYPLASILGHTKHLSMWTWTGSRVVPCRSGLR